MGLLAARPKYDLALVLAYLQENKMCAGKIEIGADGGITLHDVQSQESYDAKHAKDMDTRNREMVIKLVQFGIQIGLIIAGNPALLSRVNFIPR